MNAYRNVKGINPYFRSTSLRNSEIKKISFNISIKKRKRGGVAKTTEQYLNAVMKKLPENAK